jgi:hypothetical protein
MGANGNRVIVRGGEKIITSKLNLKIITRKKKKRKMHICMQSQKQSQENRLIAKPIWDNLFKKHIP